MDCNKLSSTAIKALTILNVEYGKGITAGQFARLMWPDSEAWKRVKNTGNGATRGKGMWLSAGSYLAKLNKRGFITVDIPSSTQLFRLSFEGRKALKSQID